MKPSVEGRKTLAYRLPSILVPSPIFHKYKHLKINKAWKISHVSYKISGISQSHMVIVNWICDYSAVHTHTNCPCKGSVPADGCSPSCTHITYQKPALPLEEPLAPSGTASTLLPSFPRARTSSFPRNTSAWWSYWDLPSTGLLPSPPLPLPREHSQYL